MQFIFVSTRLRRWWYPLHRRQIVRSSRSMARRASFRAPAPGPSFTHGSALRHGGMTALAPCEAMASRQARPSWAPSAVTEAIGSPSGI